MVITTITIDGAERKITKLCTLSLLIYLENKRKIRKKLMEIWEIINGPQPA